MSKFFKKYSKIWMLAISGTTITALCTITGDLRMEIPLSPSYGTSTTSEQSKLRISLTHTSHHKAIEPDLTGGALADTIVNSQPTTAIRQNFDVNSTDDQDADSVDVEEQMDRIEDARVFWDEEKHAFYEQDLGLTDTEINAIRNVNEEAGKSIKAVVAAITSITPKIEDHEIGATTNRIVEKLNLDVKKIVGDDRYQKILDFRQTWNDELNARFGISFKLNGF